MFQHQTRVTLIQRGDVLVSDQSYFDLKLSSSSLEHFSSELSMSSLYSAVSILLVLFYWFYSTVSILLFLLLPFQLTHLQSTLEMCVRRDLLLLHGSMKQREVSTLARTPSNAAPSWSTEVHTNAHAPLGRSVTHVLKQREDILTCFIPLRERETVVLYH